MGTPPTVATSYHFSNRYLSCCLRLAPFANKRVIVFTGVNLRLIEGISIATQSENVAF